MFSQDEKTKIISALIKIPPISYKPDCKELNSVVGNSISKTTFKIFQ